MRAILLALLIVAGQVPASEADDALVRVLASDLSTPGEYVVRQFEDADVVLLGEDHAIAQTLHFVQSLIPELHRAGVRNLVVEFGAEEDQPALDRLLTAPIYDADAVKALMFRYNTAWSWTEYRDLYEAAWRFNQQLPATEVPFRIVHMSYIYRWQEFSTPRTPEVMRRVFWRGTVDRFRSDVIEQQVLQRGEKALVLTGTVHAFTRYEMPRLDGNAEGFCGYDANWLGARLLRRHPGRITSVLVHQPFPNQPGRQPAHVQPAGGAIERIMARLDNAPRGFDLRNGAMGTLPDLSYYAICHDDLRMADLFDGYLFLAPIRELRPATVDPSFVDAANIEEALRQYPDPDWKAPPKELVGFRAHLAGMADEIRRRYAAVE